MNDIEYKQKMRKQYEELGYWIPLSKKSDYAIYYKLSNWIERIYQYITDELQLMLLKTRGVYSHKNTSGAVRDHIYSRKSGYEAGVFPEILRHPANCQILTHSDNVKKKKSRYTDADH